MAKWGKSPVAYEAEIGFFDGDRARAAACPIVAAHCVCRGRGGPGDPQAPRRRRLAQSRVEHEALLRDRRRSRRWHEGGSRSGRSARTVRRARTTTSRCSRPWTSRASSPRSATGDPTVLPARDLVAAATRSGAQALGLGERIGSIEPGKRADLIAIDVANPHVEPFDGSLLGPRLFGQGGRRDGRLGGRTATARGAAPDDARRAGDPDAAVRWRKKVRGLRWRRGRNPREDGLRDPARQAATARSSRRRRSSTSSPASSRARSRTTRPRPS